MLDGNPNTECLHGNTQKAFLAEGQLTGFNETATVQTVIH